MTEVTPVTLSCWQAFQGIFSSCGLKKGDVNHSCIWDNSVQKAIKNLVLGLFMNMSAK